MRFFFVIILFFFHFLGFTQPSDFANIDFTKADKIARSIKVKKLYNLNKLTYSLTENLDTKAEKVRAIYTWICTNVANDFRLYSLNERKRRKYLNDSINLDEWNSKFKKKLFKRLYKRKKTICTGYAYLFKEMCNIIGVSSKMVNGFGKTATTDFSKLPMPNHTWNVVKLNNQWYLCDPTWSAGISFPEDGTFTFNYNDGYFLTDPNIFKLNHFPIEKQYALLEKNAPSFQEFNSYPIIYGEAYNYIKRIITPLERYNELDKNQIFTFSYELQKLVSQKDIKLVVFNGIKDKVYKPIVNFKENILNLQHTFNYRGFYDVHLYLEEKLIATYVFKIKKPRLE